MKSISILLLLISLVACGPGVTDGEFSIKAGYAYADSGSNGKQITYRANPKSLSVIVVDARVDTYFVDGDNIIVARHPAEFVKRGQFTDLILVPGCEFYKIEIETRRVVRLSDASQWSKVRCY